MGLGRLETRNANEEMRLAISGSHATGKSTLAFELCTRLPAFSCVEEAYLDLIGEGHAFGARPTCEDIELQLRHSLSVVEATAESNVIFDRCPIDYLAYLTVLGADSHTLQFWIHESRDALATLDTVVFVPIEARDRIEVGAEDLPKLRRSVDRVLRDILIGDSWGFNLKVHECHGSPSERAAQVMSSIEDRRHR